MYTKQWGNPRYYSLCFVVSEPQEATHSAVKVFVRTTQLITTEGKPIFVWWVLLLQFICLHVWSVTLLIFQSWSCQERTHTFQKLVSPGLSETCDSFPFHLLSKVWAEIKQLSWIISGLHISVNNLTLKIYAKIFKISTDFNGICCPFNIFEN